MHAWPKLAWLMSDIICGLLRVFLCPQWVHAVVLSSVKENVGS